MTSVIRYNYESVFQLYKNNKLEGLEIPGKKTDKKIVELSKSIVFNSLIDKIVQLIIKIFSRFPGFTRLEWPKRYMIRQTKKVLLDFSKTSLNKLPNNNGARTLDHAHNGKGINILPYNYYAARTSNAPAPYDLFNEDFFDVTTNRILPLLDPCSRSNFIEAELKSLPIANKKRVALHYLECVKNNQVPQHMPVLLLALHACGKDLKALNIQDRRLTDEDLKNICDFCPNLTTLSISNCRLITNSGLKNLEQLSHLESLDLSGCYEITDKGIATIRKLKKLKSLSVGNCSMITEKGFNTIVKLKQLRSLDISSCSQFSSKSLNLIGNLSKLTSLKMSKCNVSKQVLHTIVKNHKKLNTLDVSKSLIPRKLKDGIRLLENIKNLKSLNISGNNLCGIDLGKLKHLTYLSVGVHSLEDTAQLSPLCSLKLELGYSFNLNNLSKFEQLKSLVIIGSISDKQMKIIAQCKNLTSLNLWNSELTEKGYAILAGLRNLKSLDIKSRVVLDDAKLKQISKLVNLNKLKFNSENITKKGFKFLLSLKNLRSLKLSNGFFRNKEGLQTLSKLKNLSELSFSFFDTDYLKSLELFKNLTHLKIGICDFDQEGWEVIAKMKYLHTVNCFYVPSSYKTMKATHPELLTLIPKIYQ